MSTILTHVAALILRDLNSLRAELDLFEDESQVWATPAGITNPAGTLVLHACGNLRHYVGHTLGKTPYRRDRENEFSNRTTSRSGLQTEIQKTIKEMEDVVPRLDAAILEEPFPIQVGGLDLNTQQFLLHLATHLSMHLGQLGYLRRILTRSNTSSGPASLGPLAE